MASIVTRLVWMLVCLYVCMHACHHRSLRRYCPWQSEFTFWPARLVCGSLRQGSTLHHRLLCYGYARRISDCTSTEIAPESSCSSVKLVSAFPNTLYIPWLGKDEVEYYIDARWVSVFVRVPWNLYQLYDVGLFPHPNTYSPPPLSLPHLFYFSSFDNNTCNHRLPVLLSALVPKRIFNLRPAGLGGLIDRMRLAFHSWRMGSPAAAPSHHGHSDVISPHPASSSSSSWCCALDGLLGMEKFGSCTCRWIAMCCEVGVYSCALSALFLLLTLFEVQAYIYVLGRILRLITIPWV